MKAIERLFKEFIKGLVGEFLFNQIITNIPCWSFRKIFLIFFFYVRIGSESIIQKGCYIYPSKGSLNIGDNTVINTDCILDGRGNLYIGNNVNISREVAIYTGGHIINSPDFEYYSNKVIVEDYVWIGTRVMIMPGVTVHRGAVLLPGSVVTKDVGENEIVGGVPAVHVGIRKNNYNYRLCYAPPFM